MESNIQISICIPAYKNTRFLQRLLDSIAIQTLASYEVVVTDDSPDDVVEEFCSQYKRIENLKYFRNKPALGTPENWNEGIRRSTGKWIKLMHDDDWFNTPEALMTFYQSTLQHPECSFFFSAFQNVMEETGKVEVVKCNQVDQLILKLSSLHLFKKVYVGNPSCTFIKRDINLFYDKEFKFVVDFEYYIRIIRTLKKYHYINSVLLNIGFNSEQVTKYTFLVAGVQIPENLLLLNKLGYRILRNPVVYDYYWRMLRNLKIRRVEDVTKFYRGELAQSLIQMIKIQQFIPLSILKMGIVSKLAMTISYFISLFKPAFSARK